jgi:hypothetical protein
MRVEHLFWDEGYIVCLLLTVIEFTLIAKKVTVIIKYICNAGYTIVPMQVPSSTHGLNYET